MSKLHLQLFNLLGKDKINKLLKKGDDEDPDGGVGVEQGVRDLDPLTRDLIA